MDVSRATIAIPLLNLRKTQTLFSWIVLFAIVLVGAISGQENVPTIEVVPTTSKAAYAPGDTVLVALQIAIPKHYHFFDNPKGPGFGTPMTYSMSGQEQVEWFDLLKTKSKKCNADIGGWYFGYEGRICFFLRGKIKPNGKPGTYSETLSISGLICHTACYPVHKTVPISYSIGAQSDKSLPFERDTRLQKFLNVTRITQALEPSQPQSNATSVMKFNIALQGQASGNEKKTYAWNYSPQEAGGDFSLWLAMLLAFIAGIILNAMPCVLPVLGVKILSLAQASGMNRKKAIVHGVFFSIGVISVFLALAALAAFANFSWGRQFQDPRALAAIISLVVIFSLGMFDVYSITVPASIANFDQQKRSGMLGDFFLGVFATVLATPCSGPFLGAVLAWSFTQPWWVIFIVYGSIGAGMSFPYVALCASEKASRLLPRPGAWMNDVKKIMGFLLLGFAVYLLLGLPADMIVPSVLFCVLISLSVTVYGRITHWGASLSRKAVAIAVSLMLAAGAFYISYGIVYYSFSGAKADAIERRNHAWIDFNADSLIAAHKQGRTVLVDFTANWCMNCQYNYIMVLSKKEITDLIRRKNILALKVDMTAPNTIQDSLLHSLGSRSIPFLALFPGDHPYKPIVMRDVLTKGIVKKALEKP